MTADPSGYEVLRSYAVIAFPFLVALYTIGRAMKVPAAVADFPYMHKKPVWIQKLRERTRYTVDGCALHSALDRIQNARQDPRAGLCSKFSARLTYCLYGRDALAALFVSPPFPRDPDALDLLVMLHSQGMLKPLLQQQEADSDTTLAADTPGQGAASAEVDSELRQPRHYAPRQ